MDNDILKIDKKEFCARLFNRITMYMESSPSGRTKAEINKELGLGKNFPQSIAAGSAPSVHTIARLAAYLGVTTSDLVGDSDNAVTNENVKTVGFEYLLRDYPPEQRNALEILIKSLQKESE